MAVPNQQNIKFLSICIIILLIVPFFFLVLSTPSTCLLWLDDNFLPDDQKINNGAKSHPKSKSNDQPLLLLISYDGFRYDYIEKHPEQTHTLRWLIANGVHAPAGLKNTFITITAPNHYGIVTGLYEENHGVIANSFFDPVLNESFEYFTTRWQTDPRFFGGDPIWNANDRKNPYRATGCVMWVGCDVPINNQIPLHHVSWDGNLEWSARVDSLIAWYTDPVRPINFGLLYIEEPDETGHNYGPDSPEIAQMLKKLDQLTAYLLWRLHTANLLDKIDIIFTADHGMAAVPLLNVINMDKYINSSLYTVYGGSPNWNVLPKKGAEKQVYTALKNKIPHLTVYNKSEIPKDFHYTNNQRIMPLQLIPDLHWWITHNYSQEVGASNGTVVKMRRSQNRTFTSKISNATTGEHGYNNSIPDMHPYFIGYGKSFKNGFNVTSSHEIWNLDLYPLMCYLLGIEPSPNNGSFERVRQLLKDNGALWPVWHGAKSGISMKWDSVNDGFEVQEWSKFWMIGFKLDYLLMSILLMCLVMYFIYFWKAMENVAEKMKVSKGSTGKLHNAKMVV